MTIQSKIRDEKLQYVINREPAKISALSAGKIDKFEYIMMEEILCSDQRRVIEQAKFTYSLLAKNFEKEIKTKKNQGRNLVETLKI